MQERRLHKDKNKRFKDSMIVLNVIALQRLSVVSKSHMTQGDFSKFCPGSQIPEILPRRTILFVNWMENNECFK